MSNDLSRVFDETKTKTLKPGEDSNAIIERHQANELVFAIVGPVGSGTSVVADQLKVLLENVKFEVSIIKASKIIEEKTSEEYRISEKHGLEKTRALQDAGDLLRKTDRRAVAASLIVAIRVRRAEKMGQKDKIQSNEPIIPDGAKRAYIIDSLKHPAEVALFRNTYQDAFCLVGVGCDEAVRIQRLTKKFKESGNSIILELMKRDEKDPDKTKKGEGQRVSDTFHLADFFLENTPERQLTDLLGEKKPNPAWDIPDKLGRLIDIYTNSKIVRPTPSETGMFYAYGAKMRSACISRQVGAALIDQKGNVVATGTNEVPQAGGGVYGNNFDFNRSSSESKDYRCAYSRKQCSNTKTQNEIINEIIKEIPELSAVSDKDELVRRMRGTPIGQLIEFSRAVHAEMDALLSAARQGTSPAGSRLFVTTYPCHNCARHIVSAGVDEVQFIEPYLKSRATELHSDSITHNLKEWIPPSQWIYAKHEEKVARSDVQGDKSEQIPRVLFRPFTGVAPRLYRRAFLQDRELKNRDTGMLEMGAIDSAIRSETLSVSYAEIEVKLSQK